MFSSALGRAGHGEHPRRAGIGVSRHPWVPPTVSRLLPNYPPDTFSRSPEDSSAAHLSQGPLMQQQNQLPGHSVPGLNRMAAEDGQDRHDPQPQHAIHNSQDWMAPQLPKARQWLRSRVHPILPRCSAQAGHSGATPTRTAPKIRRCTARTVATHSVPACIQRGSRCSATRILAPRSAACTTTSQDCSRCQCSTH